MMKYCKNCIHAKPKQGLSIDYCGRHRRWVTKYTLISDCKNGEIVECKDYEDGADGMDRTERQDAAGGA